MASGAAAGIAVIPQKEEGRDGEGPTLASSSPLSKLIGSLRAKRRDVEVLMASSLMAGSPLPRIREEKEQREVETCVTM